MGPYIATLITFLIDHGKMNIDDLVLIGFSLGAHMAGIAGKNLPNYTIPMIVGLDPASPLFSLEEKERRLDKGDARYVEIIHSNAGLLGMAQPLGHASFYPNGGRKQPGCGWDLVSKCSHTRAYFYYAESIFNLNRFYAWQCESFEDILNGECHINNATQTVTMGGESVDKK